MKNYLIIFSLLISFNLFGQSNKKPPNTSGFKYPVIVKLVDGQGNIFRIGFLRYNDYFDAKEDDSEFVAYYGKFLNGVELQNKSFVYFPTSPGNGEMLIIDKSNFTKMDMTYEQAMKIIIPE